MEPQIEMEFFSLYAFNMLWDHKTLKISLEDTFSQITQNKWGQVIVSKWFRMNFQTESTVKKYFLIHSNLQNNKNGGNNNCNRYQLAST